MPQAAAIHHKAAELAIDPIELRLRNAVEEGVGLLTIEQKDAPDAPEYVEIGFEKGDAVSVNGEALSPAALLTKLNELGDDAALDAHLLQFVVGEERDPLPVGREKRGDGVFSIVEHQQSILVEFIKDSYAIAQTLA